MRKKKPKKPLKKWQKILYDILFLIALGVFIYSGYQLYHIYSQNHAEEKEKIELQQLSNIPDDLEKDFTVNWKALKKKNDEILAWILIPDTNINYPIVKGSDNSFYLTHSFEKKENYAGAISMDYQADGKFKDRNTIIYGHNMWHKTMFTDIEKFKEKAFFDKHPYLYIFTPQQNYRCEIFSIHSAKDLSASYDLNYPTKESWQQYLNMVEGLSDFKRNVKLNTQDHIVTLSTCSYEEGNSTDLRYLLHAKLVKWDGSYKVKKGK